MCAGTYKLGCVNVGPTVGKHVDKLLGRLEVRGQKSKGKCDTYTVMGVSRGQGVLEKIPSMVEIQIFSGVTQRVKRKKK